MFDIYHIHSVQENHNVKVFDTYGCSTSHSNTYYLHFSCKWKKKVFWSLWFYFLKYDKTLTICFSRTRTNDPKEQKCTSKLNNLIFFNILQTPKSIVYDSIEKTKQAISKREPPPPQQEKNPDSQWLVCQLCPEGPGWWQSSSCSAAGRVTPSWCCAGRWTWGGGRPESPTQPSALAPGRG